MFSFIVVKKLIDFFSQRLTIPNQKPITNQSIKMFSTKSLKIQRPDSSVFTFEELKFKNLEAFQEFLKCFENKTTNIIPASSDSEPNVLDTAFIQESNSPNENAQQEVSPKSGSSSYNRAYYEKRKNNPAFKSKNAEYAKEYYLKHKDDPEYKRKKSESSKRRRQEKKAQTSITIQAEA